MKFRIADLGFGIYFFESRLAFRPAAGRQVSGVSVQVLGIRRVLRLKSSSYSFSSSYLTANRIMLRKFPFFDYEDDLIEIEALNTIAVI